MATFAYTGRMRSGERISGECGAESIQEAVAGLRREQIVVTRIEAANAGRRNAAPARRHRAVKPRSLAAFTRQFAVMIDAGLPLVSCLELLGSRGIGPRARTRHPADPRRCRARRLAGRRDEKASGRVRSALREHDCGRRDGRHPRHHPRAACDLHREGREAQGQVASAMIYPVAVITIADDCGRP